MARRMTWKEIQREYPDQCVCMANIIWADTKKVDVKEAEVIASEKDATYGELTKMAISSGGKVVCYYTETNPLYNSGVLPYVKG